MLQLTTNNLTMSSREIAELVESRHDNVKTTMERLLKREIIAFTATQEPTDGGGKPTTVYHVNKRDSYVVVAQLSPEFTARLVDRWQELENNQAPKLPQTFSEALQLAADQAKQLEQQAPLVKFANTVQSSSTLIDMKDLAKLISDTTIKIGRNTLMKLLRDRGFLNKDNTPSQKAVDADLMKAVERPWTNSKTDEVELTVVAQCTGKGQIYFCNNVRKFLEVK